MSAGTSLGPHCYPQGAFCPALSSVCLAQHPRGIYNGWSCTGYQLVGRTLPIWNTFGRVKPFTPQTPWLLRFFDQVRSFQTNPMQSGCSF